MPEWMGWIWLIAVVVLAIKTRNDRFDGLGERLFFLWLASSGVLLVVGFLAFGVAMLTAK